MPNNTGSQAGSHRGGDGRGFAGMDDEKQSAIASKGGQAVSQNREHMAEIGRKGGESVSQNREHMAEIGREGGHHSHGGPPQEGGEDRGEARGEAPQRREEPRR